MERSELRILSLGAGVQSSALAIMAARGDIEPIDAAIFADTQAEPAAVYGWLKYLEEEINKAKYPFKIHQATAGNLYEDSLVVKTSSRSGNRYSATKIPAFLMGPEGKKGLLGRKCTADYKVKVIQKKTRELLGIKRFNKKEGLLVDQLIGISTDEATREKKSHIPAIRLIYPLLDMGMSRTDCINYMLHLGYPEPPKSACIFCPFHSDAMWLEIKSNTTEWEQVVAFERQLQVNCKNDDVTRGKPYLHASCVDIDKVEFKPKVNKSHPQVNMFGNECEGLCGV